jgi:hypothetical protein
LLSQQTLQPRPCDKDSQQLAGSLLLPVLGGTALEAGACLLYWQTWLLVPLLLLLLMAMWMLLAQQPLLLLVLLLLVQRMVALRAVTRHRTLINSRDRVGRMLLLLLLWPGLLSVPLHMPRLRYSPSPLLLLLRLPRLEVLAHLLVLRVLLGWHLLRLLLQWRLTWEWLLGLLGCLLLLWRPFLLLQRMPLLLPWLLSMGACPLLLLLLLVVVVVAPATLLLPLLAFPGLLSILLLSVSFSCLLLLARLPLPLLLLLLLVVQLFQVQEILPEGSSHVRLQRLMASCAPLSPAAPVQQQLPAGGHSTHLVTKPAV